MNYTCYDYITKHCNTMGDFDAVIHYYHRTKYSDFMAEIDSISGYLNSIGVKKGDVITVFLPTVPHCFTAFYAINQIGAIANIVHPLTSPEVLDDILDSVDSKAIFVLDILTDAYSELLNKRNENVIVCSNSDFAVGPVSLSIKAYEYYRTKNFLKFSNSVSYTDVVKRGKSKTITANHDGSLTAVYLHGGGTTGQSKTIKLTSNNINAIAEHLKKFEIKDHKPGEESSLVVLPMFHAFGLAIAMHFPLSQGFSLVPMPEFSPEKANKMIKKYNVSFLLGVPNMFKKMMDDEHFKGEHLKSLRLVFCGGDFLPEKLVEEFNDTVKEFGGSAKLFRGYGLTEVSSVCTANNYQYSKPNSVGKALDGVVIEIWDENKNKLPPNTDGEIVISGDTVMEGYFNGINTVDNDGIYIDKYGVRWVLSGDIGHLDSEGFLFFTGRKKRIIIISGYNVYPADIESSVVSLPFVNDVCAVQGYKKGKPCIKLCVVLDGGIPEDKAEKLIVSHCKKNLSKFSVPRKIEFMNSFPRTKMGKVDFVKLSDEYKE